MFGMSFTEVAIVLVLALVLLGPDELPKVAKTLGKGLRDLRRASDDLKSTFEQEMVKLDLEGEQHRAGGPVLVPPPPPGSATQPAAALTTLAAQQGPLDQLHDPTVASARALAITNDPAAARAAARLAASKREDPAKALSVWQEVAAGSPPPMGAVMESLGAQVAPALLTAPVPAAELPAAASPAAATPAALATVEAASSPAASSPGPDLTVPELPEHATPAPASAPAPAPDAGPVARPAVGSVPREKPGSA